MLKKYEAFGNFREGEIMGTINIVRTIKRVHPSCMVMVKIGSFYNVYSKDAYILSYLLKYKIIEKEMLPACSFPISSLSKVENVLEKNKINYLVVDKRSNYEVEHKTINNQENRYDSVFEVANNYGAITLRVQNVYNELMKRSKDQNFNEKLKKIEMELYKNG